MRWDVSRSLLFSFLAAASAVSDTAIAAAQTPAVLPEIVVDSRGTFADGSSQKSGGFLVDKPTVGPFRGEDQNDIPFSVNSVPQRVILDQQARTRADVLRNDPSTYENAPASQFGYSNFLIRGFDASDSQSNRVDGLPFTSQASELLYAYERVDIYKGVNGLLYGFSNPGGIVNYVSKKPLPVALTDVSLNYISPTWFGGTADVSRRFGEGDQLGVRVNLAGHAGDLGIRGQKNRDELAALALDWRFTPASRVWFNSSISRNDYEGLQPNFALGSFAVPKAPDGSFLHGLPFSRHIGTQESIEGGVEGDFTPWLSGHVTAGEVAGYRDVRYNGGTLVDNLGNYTLAINPHNLWHLTDYSAEAILSPHVEAGVFKEKLDIGATFNRETYVVNSIQSSQTIGTFNFASSPIAYDPQAIGTPAFVASSVSDFNNYLVRNTLDVTRYVTVIGGIAHATYTNSSSANATGLHQEKNTPSGAVIVKPTEALSVYASYIQGLQAGSTAAQTFGAGTVTNAFMVLSPFLSTQYEAGIKYNYSNALQLNAAIFQISRQNAIYTANDAAGTSYTFSADGQQRNRGVEVTAVGQVVAGTRVFSGFAYIDPRIQASQGGLYDGEDAIGTPRLRGNLYLEQDVPFVKGLTLLGGVFYTGRTFADSLNTKVVPDYVTGDIGVKYTTLLNNANPATFRVYVQNVTGVNYFSTLLFGQLEIGDPRTYKVDVSVRF